MQDFFYIFLRGSGAVIKFELPACWSVKALKEVLLSARYPELIFTSITSLSMWSRILMKSALQTIDLSNDEEEGIGQTSHFVFHRILSGGETRWSVSQSQRFTLIG